MSDQILKARALRALHTTGTPLVLVNCWDAGSAKAIAAKRNGAKEGRPRKPKTPAKRSLA